MKGGANLEATPILKAISRLQAYVVQISLLLIQKIASADQILVLCTNYFPNKAFVAYEYQ